MSNLNEECSAIDNIYLQSAPLVAKDHDRALLSALHQQQKYGNLCDVWLVIENERFPAHKAVLASFSSYFHTLFENGQHEDEAKSKACNVKEIILSSVKKSTFLVILNFIYTSNLHVVKENFNDILRTSRKLQISGIVELCTKVIEDETILPTLIDAEKPQNNAEVEADNQATNKILYVDLNDCADENSVTGEITQDSGQNLEKDSDVSNGNYRQHVTGKSHHLGFEKLPDTHSNGWPMRSRVTSSSCIVQSPTNCRNELHSMAEPLQVRSVYSIATHTKGKKPTGLVTNATSSSSATQPCFSHNSNAQNFNVKVRPRKVYTCSHCEKPFSKKANLQRHILIKHTTGHRYSCPKCNKTYAIKQSLRYHLTTSDCMKLPTLHRDTPNTINTTEQLTQPLSSYNHHANSNHLLDLSSLEMQQYANIHSNQKVPISNAEVSLSNGFPHQSSLVSTSVEDVISLNIPTTVTLFPTIANLDMSTSFDPSTIDGTISKFAQSSSTFSHLSHSTPVYEQSTNSDDDMPTISRVQSIRQSFLSDQGDGEDDSATMTTPFMNDQLSSQSDLSSCPTTQTMTTIINSAPGTPVDGECSSGSVSNMKTTDEHTDISGLNPVDISSFADLLNLSNTVEGNRYHPIQPALATTHSYDYPSSANHVPTPANANINIDNNVHVCVTCNHLFSSMEAFDQHKRKCCKCPFCNRLFTAYNNMKRHINIFHIKQKPHKCKVCGRAYGIKQSMRIHMLNKHGIPFITRKYQYKNRDSKII
ncbi:uncharacterized protein LOC120336583 [Styela clava]